MLPSELYREEGLTNIYVPNVDINIIKSQLKEMSPTLSALFDSGDAQLSLQAPSKSRCAGIVISLNTLKAPGEEIFELINTASVNLGTGLKGVYMDIGLGKVGFLTESYVPSAYVSQTKYVISELPS